MADFPEDCILLTDLDALRDLRMTERKRRLQKGKAEVLRRAIQERVDEIAEAYESEDFSLVEVLMGAFPDDLKTFDGLNEAQQKKWIAKAKDAANGFSCSSVDGESLIYFVSGDDERVKIGFTKNLGSRLRSLQTVCSRELRVLLTIPGTSDDERELHGHFSADCIRGEWFYLSEPILEFIANKRDGMNLEVTDYEEF